MTSPTRIPAPPVRPRSRSLVRFVLLPTLAAFAMILLPFVARAEKADAAAPDAAAAEAPAPDAAAVVLSIQNALIDCMKSGPTTDVAARAERLRPVLDATHDLPYISRVVLGGLWSKLSDDDRKRFIDRFRELSVVSYAANFDSFGDHRFEILGVEQVKAGQELVRSVFHHGGEKTQFDYLLGLRDGRRRVINVVVDGVSDLALKRSEYADIVQAEGFEGLLKKIDAKIEDNLRGVKSR